MAKTGNVAVIDSNAAARHEAWPAPAGMRARLLSGLSVIAVLASVALPVTIDTGSMMPAVSTALADNGNGNGDGQGKGIGNGKGRGDEMGGGNGDNDDDDDDHDDDGGLGDSDDDDDGLGAGDHTGEPGGDNADDFGDIGDTDLADEMADVAGVPAEALAAPSAQALPTVREIFALGEESVLSAEQELLAIKNGWNLQN